MPSSCQQIFAQKEEWKERRLFLPLNSVECVCVYLVKELVLLYANVDTTSLALAFLLGDI